MLIVDPVPMFADNYAWLLRDGETDATALVDPADAEASIAAVRAAGGRLDLILLTHHHDDHIAGVDTVRAHFGGSVPVAGAAADSHRLPRLDLPLREGDTVRLGQAEGRVIDTPGHTIGHISYFFSAGPALFCGDTLFAGGCGRLLEGTAADMFASLGKFAALPGETRVYCGHEYTASNLRFALTVDPGNEPLRTRAARVREARAAHRPTVPSTLAEERETNPFVRAPTAARLGEIRSAKDRA